MNKEKLGMELSRKRGNALIKGLSKYAVRSIEEGRSSYPVANLLTYCRALSLQMTITDMAMDESYPVDTIQEVHGVLQMLMKRWGTGITVISQRTGFHYTAPKDGEGSLSIVTLLAMCEVLHCKLDFV